MLLAYPRVSDSRYGPEYAINRQHEHYLVTGSFLAGDALEIFHFSRNYRRPDEADLIDARRIGARLVVLDEQLNVLHALKLDKTQRNDDTICKRLGIIQTSSKTELRINMLDLNRN